jgi:serine/threonine protein kinase
LNECEIFMAALEISSPLKRSAFLDEACGRNRTSRARIEALLASYADAGSLLEHPAIKPPPTLHFDPMAEQPGNAVGPYRLLEQIGEGGMGIVFLAEQSQPVRRNVALKIIKPGMDSRKLMARFTAEKQALALMDHPNIARVLDAGTTDSGRYFVMELVDGIPITEYCDAHRLPLQARLELFVQICQAVQHAHQKGIIHRDLKPSNILVAVCDGRPIPKVIDFGVAKSAGPTLTQATLLTELGQVVGTLEYMSPEQAELDQPDVDTRSDIFSLGVLLYELLTGTTPLERQRLKETTLVDGLRLIREEEPSRPSSRLTVTEALPTIAANRGLDSKQLSRQVRGDLDWIVMKCLEKDRERRYATANGLAADVQRYLHDEPVLASPPSAEYRFRKFARKHRSAIAVAAGFAAVLLTGTVISTILAVRASQATALAKANEQRALEKEQESLASAQQARQAVEAERLSREKEAAHRQRAEAISSFLLTAFQSSDSARHRSPIPRAEVLAQSVQQVRSQLDDCPTKMDLLHIVAESYYDLGLYGEAIPLWEEIRAYLVRTFGPDHSTTLAVSGNLAVAYRQAGRLVDARQLFEEILERMRRVLGPDHRQTRITTTHLSQIYRRSGQLDKALPLAEEGLKLSRDTLGLDHPETLWATKNLADAYLADSRLDEAFELEESVNRRKVALAPLHPDTIASLRSLADRYARHGRTVEAAREFARLFEIKPDDHGCALRAALLYLAADDQKSYEAVCGKMLDRFAHTHDGWAANRTSLACLVSPSPIGDVQELVRLADVAVAAFDDDAKLVDRMISCRTRGLAAYRAGDFQGTLEWCQSSRDLEAQRNNHPPYIATNLIVEAMAYYQRGNPAEARAALDESSQLIEQSFPNAPENLGSDWFDWLLYNLLRREAVELLGRETPAAAEHDRMNADPAIGVVLQ